LRKWFAHEQSKFPKFKERYLKELKENTAFQKMVDLALTNDTITLLFSASDTQHNNAVVLWGALQHEMRKAEKRAAKALDVEA
ncbi:MAG: DUF488 domain-containing protein, partial [Candidatus Micrarchaeales archaeon]